VLRGWCIALYQRQAAAQAAAGQAAALATASRAAGLSRASWATQPATSCCCAAASTAAAAAAAAAAGATNSTARRSAILRLGMLSRTAEERQQQQEEPVPASMAAASMHVFASKLAYRPVRACLHAGAVTLSQALRFMYCPLACVCQATILDKCQLQCLGMHCAHCGTKSGYAHILEHLTAVGWHFAARVSKGRAA
jgi:hypothetical protein